MNGAGQESNGSRHDWPVVRVPPAVMAQLRQAAGENERTVSGEVRYALGLYLRQLERRRSGVAAS